MNGIPQSIFIIRVERADSPLILHQVIFFLAFLGAAPCETVTYSLRSRALLLQEHRCVKTRQNEEYISPYDHAQSFARNRARIGRNRRK